MYRPGILHVVPDALSRMYSASYYQNEDVWGTHDNIRLIRDSFKELSPMTVVIMLFLIPLKRFRPQ